MNVLMVAPLSAGVVNGGVRMQMTKTAQHLEEAGVQITRFNPWKLCDPARFDLVHLFLASAETLAVAKRVGGIQTKLVVTPVFYTRRSPDVIRKSISAQHIGSKLFKGFFSDYSIKSQICHCADLVLPNTEDEARLICDGFGIPRSSVQVIPNGVDPAFAQATPDLFTETYSLSGFTLFVGDASAQRKNLLPLLEQTGPGDPPLVVIGRLDQSEYSQQCKKKIQNSPNIRYIGPLNHGDPMLSSAYAAASVFVLPSQFETPGIAALEAALAGCTIAITSVGGTRQYFGEYAFYINPEKPETIGRAVLDAHKAETSPELKNKILENYTWQKVAGKTLDAYQHLLER